MNEQKKSKKELKTFEIVAYSICATLALWGIAEIIMGIVDFYMTPSWAFHAAATKFKSLFGLSFTGWGCILLGLGAILAVIILCIYAKSTDREYEKAQRRAARLGKETAAPEVVEAKVEPVSEETPKAE